MTNNNVNSSILSEHRSVVKTRYILAIFNFLAIFAGTLVTLFFVSRRGVYDVILKHLYVLAVINILQIILCITEYVLRNHKGISYKRMPLLTYGVGVLWLLALVGELVSGTMKLGTLRTDLAIIAGIQLFVAIMTYLTWPSMDRRAIDAMIRPSVRGDEKKRAKKARSFVRRYAVLFVVILLAQVGTLVAYKMPPTFYDLFSDTRALEYELNEEGDGYIVTAVYKGTSTKVNIPATYNNLPVVGIAKGALIDDNLLENYQYNEIVFGTPTTVEGESVLVSNLQYLEDGAIANNKIETLTLPASLKSIGVNAVRSSSLRTVEYCAAADFRFESFAECTALSKVVMSGDSVGKIISLNGMDADRVVIQVNKDIYNRYRENNLNYVKSFRPILPDDEFCVDFYTNCDYYIDSIFCKIGESVSLKVTDLKKASANDKGLTEDTAAYLADHHELGTDGAKAHSAFRGWYYDAAFVSECDISDTTALVLTGNTSLHAKWIDEYKAVVDWGVMPDRTGVRELYWTDEDVCTFPVVTDRVGYSRGVVWSVDDSTEQVFTSAGIKKDVTLKATWLLDAPVISIAHTLSGAASGEETTQNYAAFVYDEHKVLSLSANRTHPLDGRSLDGRVTDYTYEWIRQGSTEPDKAPSVNLQNVADTGIYTLRVTVHSPYGETATSEVTYEARIDKKPIDIGTAELLNESMVYNATNRTLVMGGTLNTERIDVLYKYYSNVGGVRSFVCDNVGVMNAGTYTVEAVLSKNNAAEAANYETRTLTATMQITPKPLSFISWSNDSFVYNGTERTVVMNVGGILGSDVVEITYRGNKETDAGSNYTAVAVGVTNPNYSFAAIEATNDNTLIWRIDPKPVTVKNWQTDGSDWSSFSVVYDGRQHSVYAVLEGAIEGDVVSFVYDHVNHSVNEQINAGQYVASIIGTTNSNYVYDADAVDARATQVWEITRRTLTINYLSSGTFYYNGQNQGIGVQILNFCGSDAENFNIEMLDLADNTATARFISAENGIYTIAMTGLDAGSYTANIQGLIGSSEMLNNYTMSTGSRSFTIRPKPLTVTAPAAALVYNGSAQEYCVRIGGMLEEDLPLFAFEQFGTTALSGRVEEGEFLLSYRGTDAGSYTLSVSDFSFVNGNYVLSDPFSGSFSIARKPISVSAWQIADMANGSALLPLEGGSGFVYNYSGYRVNAILSGVVSGESVVISLNRADYRDAGAYRTIATLDEAVYTNYTLLSNADVSWQITPYVLDLSWTVNGGTATLFTYDGVEKVATPSFAALGDDTVSLIYGMDGRSRTDAGLAEILVARTDSANYTLGRGASFSFTILPKTVTVGFSDLGSVFYNGSYQGPEFTISGLVASDVESGNLSVFAQTGANSPVSGSSQPTFTFLVDGSASYSFADQSFAVDAGEYEISRLVIYKNGAVDGNYTVEAHTSFRILPKTIALTGVWQYQNSRRASAVFTGAVGELIYNKATYTFTTEIASGLVERLGVLDTVTLDYEGTNAGMNAGTYTTTVSGLLGTYAANYTLPDSNAVVEWTVVPKIVTLNWSSNSFIYNGSNRTQSASLSSSASADDDGRIYSGDSYSLSYDGNVASDAGSYVATVLSVGNSNYALDASSNTEYEWSIAKRAVSLSWSYTSIVYNGSVQYPQATVSNAVYGDAVNVTGYTGYAGNRVAATGYTVSVTAIDNENYTLEEGTNLTATYDITKRVLETRWYATYDGVSKVELSSLVYNGRSATVLVEFLNKCTGDDVEPVYSTNVFLDAADDYTVSLGLSGEDSANYTLDGLAVGFGIAKKPVTVTWLWDGEYSSMPTIVYDGSAHTLVPTISGLVGSDATGREIVWTRVSGGTNFTAAGAYDAGLFCVSIESLTNPNYTVEGVSSAVEYIEILPQPVRITWSGEFSAVYDGIGHQIQASVVGKNNGVTVPFHYLNDENGAINAGSYTFYVSTLDDQNYTLEGVTGSLSSMMTVAPRVVEISWANNTTFVYTAGVSHTLEASVTNVALGDRVDVIYNGSNTYTNAGSYTAVITGVDNSNYTTNGAQALSATMIIEKRVVSVIWSGTNAFTYDGNTHALTATVTDSDSNPVDFVYQNNNNRNAGRYTVSIRLSDTANYTVNPETPVTRTLVINPRTLGVTWTGMGEYTYSYGETHTLEAQLTNVVSGDTVTPVIDGYTMPVSGVGVYTNTVTALSGSSAGNYSLPTGATVTATLTIVPQAVRITWTGATSVEYDGSAHRLTVTVVGATDGNAVPFVASGIGSYDAAGVYNYAVTELQSTNYTLSGAIGDLSKTLTIEKRVVTLDWTDLEQVVGSTYAPTAVVTNAVVGEAVTAVISVPQNVAELTAGAYDLTVTALSGADAANYTLVGATNLAATLTVTAS
ncbi:MAG: hypothetical protein E7663_02830 [Ruminococcaceae bacterium]|nr:hypothetical protein [Oscillospiraceae bacterium]